MVVGLIRYKNMMLENFPNMDLEAVDEYMYKVMDELQATDVRIIDKDDYENFLDTGESDELEGIHGVVPGLDIRSVDFTKPVDFGSGPKRIEKS
jgi:hypothetical protein